MKNPIPPTLRKQYIDGKWYGVFAASSILSSCERALMHCIAVHVRRVSDRSLSRSDSDWKEIAEQKMDNLRRESVVECHRSYMHIYHKMCSSLPVSKVLTLRVIMMLLQSLLTEGLVDNPIELLPPMSTRQLFCSQSGTISRSRGLPLGLCRSYESCPRLGLGGRDSYRRSTFGAVVALYGL